MNAPPQHPQDNRPDSRPDALTAAVLRLAARPRAVLLVAGLLCVLALALASRLQLRTAISELLPTNDPAVQALERTKHRVSDLSLLLVGIRSPDRQANLRYAAALTDHLSKLPPTVVELAAYHLRDLQQFIEKNRWLYLSAGDLEELRDRLQSTLVRRKNPFAIDLGDEPGSDAHARDRLASAARAQQHALEQRFPGGYFVRGDYAWVATLPAGGMVGERAGDRLIEAVRAFVAAHPPAGFHPQMQVQPAGPVQSAIQNREAVERDILSVTVVCVFIIGLSLALFFRSKRWLLLVVSPAMLGTLIAFAVAALAVGYLNSSTAFLGSIILGNGINYAIILGARYREHRRQGRDPSSAMQVAVAGVWRSTLAAALAAAAAYASLLFTGFRGFSQFGLMGAVGCLVCWAATFTVMPALILVADRGRSPAGTPARAAATGPTRFDIRPHLRPLVIAAAGLTLLALLGLRHFAQSPFEYDFRRLSTDSDHDDDYRQFDRNLDALFGSWHSPTVLLADRLDQVEPMRQAIRRQDRSDRPYIGRVITIYDVLPGTPPEQRQKLQVLADIRRLAGDPATALLDKSDRKLLRENLPPADLRELGPMDLPPLARRPFTERDGSVGRALLAYHNSPQVSMWNGHDLLGIGGVLARLSLPDGSVIESSGPAMIFGGMLRSILRDGPLATGLSFLGVLLVVTLFVRPLRAALLAVGGLLLGVLWMVGAAGHLGVRINFLNFIALPITFGIGVEYAVNVVARLSERNAGDPSEWGSKLLATGAAVTLCSWTTIVGYGSLLAAHSRALRGFGTLAILGEIACLLAAVLVLPALYAWRLRNPGTTRPSSSIVTAAPEI
jgi:uncharacterized protein